MSTIYWIETLDAILFFFIVGAIISLIIGGTILAGGLEDKNEKATRIGIKILCICVISFMAYTFTPSTKKAYKIVGIGGTIDYLKNNDTAKQMPDKCIKALDLFLDKAIEKNDSINIKK